MVDRPTLEGSDDVSASPECAGWDQRFFAWLLTFGGAGGLVASFTLLVEKIALLKDPDYVPTCSINPILSCGSVMVTEQAEVFGFPNPVVGVIGFSVVVTIGAGLVAGARFGRRFWLGLQAGVTFGIVFVHWLIFQSLYRIGALCPYCMVVWVVMIPLFFYTTLQNVRLGNMRPPAALRGATSSVVAYHGVVLTSWYLAIGALIAVQFWSYWSTLLS